MLKYTQISVSPELKEILFELKKVRYETYDQYIRFLLNNQKEVETHERTNERRDNDESVSRAKLGTRYVISS